MNRYDIDCDHYGGTLSSTGSWCKWSDVEALQDRTITAEAERDDARDFIAQIVIEVHNHRAWNRAHALHEICERVLTIAQEAGVAKPTVGPNWAAWSDPRPWRIHTVPSSGPAKGRTIKGGIKHCAACGGIPGGFVFPASGVYARMFVCTDCWQLYKAEFPDTQTTDLTTWGQLNAKPTPGPGAGT